MHTYGKFQKKLGTDSIETDFCVLFSKCWHISSWHLNVISLDKFIFVRSSFLTKQKWHGKLELADL